MHFCRQIIISLKSPLTEPSFSKNGECSGALSVLQVGMDEIYWENILGLEVPLSVSLVSRSSSCKSQFCFLDHHLVVMFLFLLLWKQYWVTTVFPGLENTWNFVTGFNFSVDDVFWSALAPISTGAKLNPIFLWAGSINKWKFTWMKECNFLDESDRCY